MQLHRSLMALLLTLAMLVSASCARQYSVSVNNRTVYDPRQSLPAVTLADPSLQACLNLALQDQDDSAGAELLALSCPNSGITSLEGLENLPRLRFLDLAGNLISNLAPLSALHQLSGLNLPNNRINDISPLLELSGLSAVVLTGNAAIPCAQLEELRRRLGDSLTAPASCRR